MLKPEGAQLPTETKPTLKTIDDSPSTSKPDEIKWRVSTSSWNSCPILSGLPHIRKRSVQIIMRVDKVDKRNTL
jgi:hypothetical protein